MPYKKGESGNQVKKWKPGQCGNPAGRPKKLVNALKDLGYKQSEVNDCLQVLFALGLNELKKIEKSDEHTMIERTVAAALVNGLKKKSLYNVLQLLERVYGRPKETIDQTINGKVKVTMNLGGEK